MIIKEKDAREMYCCMSMDNSAKLHNCHGAKCMAWVWKELKSIAPTDEDYGTCGLIRKPRTFVRRSE